MWKKIIKLIIDKFISFFGYKLIKVEDNKYQQLIRLYYLKKTKNFFFVQLGANDGKGADPLHDFIIDYQPNGILVEPQTKVFNDLKKTYVTLDNLSFANIAIYKEDCEHMFYTVKESFRSTLNKHSKINRYRKTSSSAFKKHIKCNATGIGSFSKEHITNYLKKVMGSFFNEKEIEKYIETIYVKALSFESFIKTYNIKHIDLLQIDTEGYDYEIIKMIDFKQFAPAILNYEHKNLTIKDKSQCEKVLRRKGYTLFRHGGDTCAFNFKYNKHEIKSH